MQVLDELVIRMGGDPIRRKIAQNKRILSEFPWLWAVCSEWSLSCAFTKVTDTSTDIFKLASRILENDEAESHSRVRAVWIHGSYVNGDELFEKVEILWPNGKYKTFVKNRPTTTWQSLLSKYISENFYKITVHHIVLVYIHEDDVIVMRPSKPYANFNEFCRHRH